MKRTERIASWWRQLAMHRAACLRACTQSNPRPPRRRVPGLQCSGVGANHEQMQRVQYSCSPTMTSLDHLHNDRCAQGTVLLITTVEPHTKYSEKYHIADNAHAHLVLYFIPLDRTASIVHWAYGAPKTTRACSSIRRRNWEQNQEKTTIHGYHFK